MHSSEDDANGRGSDSTTNLIYFKHVGVTAKIQAPLKKLIPVCESPSTDMESHFSPLPVRSKTKYLQLPSDIQTDTPRSGATKRSYKSDTTTTSKALYEMHTLPKAKDVMVAKRASSFAVGTTPEKIEFQLYDKSQKQNARFPINSYRRRLRHQRYCARCRSDCTGENRKNAKNNGDGKYEQKQKSKDPSISWFKKIQVLSCSVLKPKTRSSNNKGGAKSTLNSCRIDDILKLSPTAPCGENNSSHHRGTAEKESQQKQNVQKNLPDYVGVSIYPFDHGCADYLRTSDCHPHNIGNAIAERATNYATRFWAEFFGALHIVVAFVITFFLQAYRFALYSLINTLLVGMLHMTSDYLLKPMLTVLFNGFMQPPLIFIYNILASVRDIVEPISEAFSHFMKPIATICGSFRLIHVNYNHKKFIKEV